MQPPLFISSPHNPRIKHLVKLRDRGERDASGEFLVDGARELSRALACGLQVLEFYHVPPDDHAPAPIRRAPDSDAAGDNSLAPPLAALREAGAREFHLNQVVWERIAYGERKGGVVAVLRQPSTRLEEFDPNHSQWLLVVEGVEKPGNLGAIFRSADGAGAGGILAADPRTDLYNPNTLRASLGTVFSVPFAAASRAQIVAWLFQHGYRVLLTRPEATTAYTAADLTGKTAIVLGSEAFGITPHWNKLQVETISIPMLGVADSLNVSVAAALLGYEALRQRSLPAARKSTL